MIRLFKKKTQPKKIENLYTIAFYNLENFFDTRDDQHILDDDFTKNGFKRWTAKRFQNKAKKIGKVIAEIGQEDTMGVPALIGIAEVENNNVIESLLKTDYLKNIDYDFVHFDSPDERGIDTALIYHKNFFKVKNTEILPLLIENEHGERDLTRDILYVNGILNEEEIHVFVNHWPSRRDGANKTKTKRIKAAERVLEKIEQLTDELPPKNIIIMGDFNDDPNSESIQTLMGSGLFINPMQKLLSPINGSANYKGKWSLFDQIIISHSFLNFEPNTHMFKEAKIFAPNFLKEQRGRYKGRPYRTYAGKKYLGGYSDHFPVYLILRKNL